MFHISSSVAAFFFLASPLIWITGVPLWPSSSTFTNDHDALTNSVVVSIGGQIIWSALEVRDKCPMPIFSLKDFLVFSVANRCFLSIFFPSLRAHYHVILIHNINMRSDSKKCHSEVLSWRFSLHNMWCMNACSDKIREEAQTLPVLTQSAPWCCGGSVTGLRVYHLSQQSLSRCPLALNHQVVSMCESSLFLSGSITHPVCLAPLSLSLSLSLPAISLSLSLP